MAGIIGWSTADTTHLGSVTTAAFLLIPLLSIPAILPIGLRMIATILATAALVGGFVCGDPRHIEEPHFFYFLSVMGFACFLSISFGHALTHTLRDRFLVSQRLSELAQSLEARVAERSRELHSLFDHIELAREQERTRIACEMHDELGQLLSASALSMDRALGQSASSAHPLSDELTRARALVGDSISFVRALLHQTQPLLLNERGLLGAIEMLLAEHESTANVDCLWSIEMDTSEFLPEETLAVFRVLQECLRNSARHAKAKRVEVLLARDGQNVVLTVRDDGVGFCMDSRREGAFGIGGMQQRAKALGGELIVHSAIDSGTQITFRFVAEKST